MFLWGVCFFVVVIIITPILNNVFHVTKLLLYPSLFTGTSPPRPNCNLFNLLLFLAHHRGCLLSDERRRARAINPSTSMSSPPPVNLLNSSYCCSAQLVCEDSIWCLAPFFYSFSRTPLPLRHSTPLHRACRNIIHRTQAHTEIKLCWLAFLLNPASSPSKRVFSEHHVRLQRLPRQAPCYDGVCHCMLAHVLRVVRAVGTVAPIVPCLPFVSANQVRLRQDPHRSARALQDHGPRWAAARGRHRRRRPCPCLLVIPELAADDSAARRSHQQGKRARGPPAPSPLTGYCRSRRVIPLTAGSDSVAERGPRASG